MIYIETGLSRRIAISFSIAFMVSIAMGLVSYWNAAQFVKSTEVVARTHRGIALLQSVLADSVSAESEMRGYIISGREEFLNLYRSSLADVVADLLNLKLSVKDTINRSLIDELEQLTKARAARLESTLALYHSEGIEAVRAATGPGKKLMDDLRRVVEQIESRQRVLLIERDSYARSLASRTMTAVVVSGILATLIAAASVVILTADVAQRERLEKEVIEISEREQRRIGQDLHDGVCQQMTGISLLGRSLQQRLKNDEAAEAGRIVRLMNECIEQTRLVTRGLHPVPDEPSGLMLALEELAENVRMTARVACCLDCTNPESLSIGPSTATHLYRIAQEAVQNALRHSEATSIVIGLHVIASSITISVADDGHGISADRLSRGLGLEIMRYRAQTIGAKLDVLPGSSNGGTIVKCSLSLMS